MKYGFNDTEWKGAMIGKTNFGEKVWEFGMKGYVPMMKRKTYTEADLKALEGLKEMVANLERAMAEKKMA